MEYLGKTLCSGDDPYLK